MPSDLLVLTASDVSSILSSLPPQPLLSHSASLFHSLISSPLPPSLTPHRTPLPLPNHTSLIMPARIPSHGSALKIVSVPSQAGDKRGLPATTLVLDEHTGALKAVVNARQLTAARTAAGTVLATTLLHPPSGSEVKRVLVFGAGAQAQAHAELLATVYASSLCALIFVVRSSRSPSTESLLTSLHARFPSLSIYAIDTPMYDSVQVSHADVIVTATPSTTPLFDSAHVKSGAHIIMVGSWRPDMREVDDALIRRAARSIVVDSRAACAKEAGEFISAEVDMDTCVEIGELVEGISEGGEVRRDELVCERVVKGGEVSIVKSVGVGAQDVAIAALVVRAAEERGVGTRVPAYDLGATED